MKNSLTLAARVEAKSGTPRRVKIVAYTGSEILTAGFGGRAWIAELSGLTIPPTFPLLTDHDNSMNAMAGTGAARVEGNQLIVDGTLNTDTPAGIKVEAFLKAGDKLQASIGADATETREFKAGEQFKANGKTFTAPRGGVVLIVRATLREVSFVPLGADGRTSVVLATGQKAKSMFPSFENWATENGFDPSNIDPKQAGVVKASWRTAVAEKLIPDDAVGKQLRADIVAGRFGDDEDRLQGARDVYELRAERAKWTDGVGLGRGNRDGANRQGSANVVTASLLTSAGVSQDVLAKHYGEQVVDAATARGERGLGIQGVLRRVMAAAGVAPPNGNFTDSTIRAAFEASRKLEASGYSTIGLPGILSDAANKLLLDSFVAVPSTWSRFCRISSNPNFKASNRYRLTMKGTFQEVAPTGEIKHVTLAESENDATLSTYGAMIALTRQTIINDDLNAFAAVPRMLGRMSAIKIEKSVYTLLLSNPSSFFAAGNANYLSGGGSALALAGLGAAYAKFLNQTDANNDPAMVMPRLLLVPPALEITGRQLMQDVSVVATTTANTPLPAGNPYAGMFDVVTGPYLGTAFGLTGASNTGWYLLTSGGDYSIMEVAFLNGQTTPTVETAEMDFNTLGVQMRAFLDFGTSMLEHRGGVFNAGA